MGQQQLLLIVLSTIIVGISIAVGINMVTSSSGQANFDAVMQDVITIGEKARAWYKKPALMGGGGNSFEDIGVGTTDMINLLGWPASNENGTYTVSTAGVPGPPPSVIFQGTGTENSDQSTDGSVVVIQVQVYRDSLITTVVSR